MTSPLVSVVIATYNAARYLPETLDSALAQTHAHREIIVVDDGSTDDTAARVASYRSRVTYIRRAHGGLAAARNAGLRMLALLMGRRLDVPTVALRYAVVYGPGQSLSNPYSTVITAFATRLCRGEAPTLYEDGEQQRDWIFVDDVVRAGLLAAGDERAGFEVFNVGSGTGRSVRELAEHLGRRLGRDIVVEPSQRYRVGDYRHLVLDITKLRALGFEPAVSLAEGLDHFVRGLDSAGTVGVLGRI